jgi:hypothetical protein
MVASTHTRSARSCSFICRTYIRLCIARWPGAPATSMFNPLGIGEAGPKSSQSSRSPAFRSWLSAGAIWQHWRTMQGDGRSSAAIHTSNRDGCVSNVKFGKSPSEGRIIRLRHCPRFPDSRTLVHHYFRGLEPRRIPVSYFRACKVLRYSMPKAM